LPFNKKEIIDQSLLFKSYFNSLAQAPIFIFVERGLPVQNGHGQNLEEQSFDALGVTWPELTLG
jgi:hypothetical protein